MNFQSPQFLTDLYSDLRDRRLLPLIVVLLAGMVLVPIALSNSSKSAPPKTAAPAAAAPGKSSLLATQVALSDPGLRNYQRRLSGDTPKDPFLPKFPASFGSGTAQSSGPSPTSTIAGSSTGGLTQTSSSGSSVALTAEGKAAAAAANSSPTSGGSSTSQPLSPTTSNSGSKVVFYRIKVRTGQVGGNMKIQDEVGPSSSLPGKSVQGLAFLGATLDTNLNAKRAFFLVSNGVSSISGDGQCSFGNPCQLLALKPGEHVDLVWIDGVQYRITLLAFERHTRDNPGNTGAIDNPPAAQGGSSTGGGSTGRNASRRKSANQRFIF